MENEILGGLLEEGLLGIIIVVLGVVIRQLYKELKTAWEGRLEALEKSAKAYVDLCTQTIATLSVRLADFDKTLEGVVETVEEVRGDVE